MQFLLTNDDGIHAPGLAALREAVAQRGSVCVLAPDEQLSGCSHQTTTNRALRLTQHADDRHALNGTPADCARIGLLHLAPETDWVLSGVNEGGNLGVDVYMSGTVAAVREAALLGRPGIAFSRYRASRQPVDWSAIVGQVEHVLDALFEKPLAPGAFWNVNLPDPGEFSDKENPDIVFCPLQDGPLPVQYEIEDGLFHFRGRYQDRARDSGTDVDVCFSGQIAVTQVLPTSSPH
jgi:5'-nucleotidase